MAKVSENQGQTGQNQGQNQAQDQAQTVEDFLSQLGASAGAYALVSEVVGGREGYIGRWDLATFDADAFIRANGPGEYVFDGRQDGVNGTRGRRRWIVSDKAAVRVGFVVKPPPPPDAPAPTRSAAGGMGFSAEAMLATSMAMMQNSQTTMLGLVTAMMQNQGKQSTPAEEVLKMAGQIASLANNGSTAGQIVEAIAGVVPELGKALKTYTTAAATPPPARRVIRRAAPPPAPWPPPAGPVANPPQGTAPAPDPKVAAVLTALGIDDATLDAAALLLVKASKLPNPEPVVYGELLCDLFSDDVVEGLLDNVEPGEVGPLLAKARPELAVALPLLAAVESHLRSAFAPDDDEPPAVEVKPATPTADPVAA